MNDLISFGNKKSYHNFRKQIPAKIQTLFDEVRDFCLKLGDDVIEDVRMHRVVFCKSITFRWFVDIEPEQDTLSCKVQRSRKDPQKIVRIKPEEGFDNLKEIFRDAYNTIR